MGYVIMALKKYGPQKIWPSKNMALKNMALKKRMAPWSPNHVAAIPNDARTVLTKQESTFFLPPSFSWRSLQYGFCYSTPTASPTPIYSLSITTASSLPKTFSLHSSTKLSVVIMFC